MDYDDLLCLTQEQIDRISDRAWQDILSRTHTLPTPRKIIRISVQDRITPIKPVTKRYALAKADWSAIVDMRQSGVPVTDIERITGVSETHIYRILARRKPSDL